MQPYCIRLFKLSYMAHMKMILFIHLTIIQNQENYIVDNFFLMFEKFNYDKELKTADEDNFLYNRLRILNNPQDVP